MEHDDSRGLPSRWKKSTRSNCGLRAIGAKSDDWILPDKALHHYATLRHRSIIRETLPISFQTTVLYAVSVTNFYLGIRGQGGTKASLAPQTRLPHEKRFRVSSFRRRWETRSKLIARRKKRNRLSEKQLARPVPTESRKTIKPCNT